MKLSLFINPEHPVGDDLGQRMREHAEQVRVARDAGFDGVTIGHHLSYGESVWLPPFETLAHLAADAQGMSLGTCMLVLPLFHPVHVAQQAALLDVLCEGRLVLGVAPGWQRDEFELAGVEHRRRFSRFREALEVITRLWSGEKVDFDGTHFQLRDATLGLTPLRRPRPPLWLGGSVTAAVQRAAQLADPRCGDSWVASSHLTREVIVEQAAQFRGALAAAGKPMPADFPVLRNIVVAADRATALREAGPALARSYQLFGKWGLFRDVVGGSADTPALDELLEGRVILGSPQECADEIAALRRDSGASRIIARVQWMGMDQRVVLRTIELLAERVRPLVEHALAGH